jgi:hypothetical protein
MVAVPYVLYSHPEFLTQKTPLQLLKTAAAYFGATLPATLTQDQRSLLLLVAFMSASAGLLESGAATSKSRHALVATARSLLVSGLSFFVYVYFNRAAFYLTPLFALNVVFGALMFLSGFNEKKQTTKYHPGASSVLEVQLWLALFWWFSLTFTPFMFFENTFLPVKPLLPLLKTKLHADNAGNAVVLAAMGALQLSMYLKLHGVKKAGSKSLFKYFGVFPLFWSVPVFFFHYYLNVNTGASVFVAGLYTLFFLFGLLSGPDTEVKAKSQ